MSPSNVHRMWAALYPNKDNAEELERFLKQVKDNTLLWEILGEHLDKKLASRVGTRPFDEENWALRTAHDKGYAKAIKDVLEVIPRPEV